MEYNCNDWNSFAPNNLNNKHPDCNGDGTVDYNDTLAVYNNFGQTHVLRSCNYLLENNLRAIATEVHLIPSASSYQTNQQGYIDLTIGTSSNHTNGIYGANYEIEFDPTLVQANSVTLDHKNAWLLTSGLPKISAGNVNSSSYSLEGAVTRTDHIDTSGFGRIARINFTTASTGTGIVQAAFRLKKIMLLNSAAYTLPLYTDSVGIFAVNITTNTPTVFSQQADVVMVDGNQQNIVLQSNEYLSGDLKIYDCTGRLIHQQKMNGDKTLFVSYIGYAKGIYLLSIESSQLEKMQWFKFVVQ